MTEHEQSRYWDDMKSKVARNLATVSGCTEPETECDVKRVLAHVLRHGSCAEKSEAIAEACEWQVAHLVLDDKMYGMRHEAHAKAGVMGVVK